MKILKVEIDNFRSLDEVSISFVNDLMCIVGRNDVGKSTFIKAMETFFSGRTFADNDFPFNAPEDTPSQITIHFSTDNESLSDFTEGGIIVIRHTYRKNASRITRLIECSKKFVAPPSSDIAAYSSLKKLGISLGVSFPNKKPDDEEIKELEESVIQRIKELEGSSHWVDITSNWTDIREHLPDLIVVPAAQDPETEQKMTSDSSAFGSLFRVGLRKLIQHDTEGKEAVSVLESKMNKINGDILNIVEEKLLMQGSTFKLSQVSNPLDVAKSFSFQMDIEDEYGVKTPLSQRGNGLQRSVLMAIIRAQSDINKQIKQMESQDGTEAQEGTGRYFYLIEEPEAFLHLSAQRELYYSIKELIQDGSQALITTHSTFFMDEGDVDQVVLLHREEGTTSATQALDIEEVKQDIGEIVQVSQLMTGKVCCLVEGVADTNAFREWFKILGYNHKELGIYFVDMKGCQNAEYYANVKVIKDFNVKFLIILDTDFHSAERVETLKRVLINEYNVKEYQINILGKGEIENYFPINKVEQILCLPENSIDIEAYSQDPKEAMKLAKTQSGEGARKYIESRDSSKIAQAMSIKDIDTEIVDVVNQMVKVAGGHVVEGQSN
ncbi:ATP-dependent nuclease [Radiobacillus sp. PE A8.2]|uniref:ATP-dependent nuclease n=1 Tax=Radiobacillus sp. PE A8.2 TaxID=3380349 RepID=UPI00388EC972